MKCRDFERRFHLNIYSNKDQDSQHKINAWSRIYGEMQKESHKFKMDPIAELVPLSKGNALTIIISGKDLFLGIYNDKTSQIINHTELNDILYFYGSTIRELYTDLKRHDISNHMTISTSLKNAIGKYIPRVRHEESLISRLPQGLTVTHTDKPFVIEIRKDLQFDDHDFMFRIDQINRRNELYIDGIQIPFESIKCEHNQVYEVFSDVTKVCNGLDLSKTSTQAILNKNSIEIDELSI